MYLEELDALTPVSVLDKDLFDELFDIEDDFKRELAIQSVSDKAKVFGVSQKFKQLLSAKKRSVKEAQKQAKFSEKPMRVSDFGSYSPLLYTGQWCADMNGVWSYSDKGIIEACKHPIYISRVLKNAETGNRKVELTYFIRGRWEKTVTDRKTISSTNSIIALADKGINVNSDNAKFLIKYLADIEALNTDEIEEQRSSGRLGWMDGTFLPYDESIVFDNEDSLKSLVDSTAPVGKRNLWFDAIKRIRSIGRFESLIYLAASFSSVLVEPCGALPFVVDLWGDSGRGKTVALMMAASIWGDPNEGGYATDAKATVTAMEIRMNALNSLPMLIDDMAQIKNQYDDFSGLVYKWCAGRGKDRSNQGLGLNKQTEWHNCILTNAERSLVTETMQQGAVNRIIDVEIEDGSIFGDEAPEFANILRNNFGFCGREFVETIQHIGFDEVRAIQKKHFEDLKEMSKHVERKEDKQMLPMSIILAADEIAEKYIFQDGIRLPLEKCFNTLKSVGEVSEHKRAYAFIMGMVASNYDLHFVYDPDKPKALWGEVDKDGYVSINATIFSKLMRDEGFQDKAFLSWAKTQGIIKCQEGRLKRKKRLGDNEVPIWCVMLKIDTSEYDEDEDFVPVPESGKETLPFE